MCSRNFFPLRLIACGLAMGLTLQAQEPKLQVKPAVPDKPATDTLSLKAKLVNLPVIVRDKQNKLVSNLTKDDFVLQVDGHPQTIRYFDKDNDLPLTIGLLVDVSRSQASVLEEERKASAQFIDQMLTATAGRKPDQAFVIQFGRSSELLQDLTDSHPKLQAAIQQIDTDADSGQNQSRGNGNNDPNDPNNPNNTGGGQQRPRRGGGTTLYDAIYLASNELMAKQTGRKALIVLTDGVDNGSKKSLASAIEAAQRADVVVYTIYFKGQERQDYNQQPMRRGGGGYPGGGGGYPGGGYPGGGYPGGGYPGGGGGGRGGNYPNGGTNGGNHVPFVDGKKVLERISGETGAAMFEVKGKNKVSVIYDQIGEELRSQYRLGYTPDDNTSAEGYHRVDLTVPRQKNYYVQTRDGYYTGN